MTDVIGKILTDLDNLGLEAGPVQGELDLDTINANQANYVMQRSDGKWMVVFGLGEVAVCNSYESARYSYRLWARGKAEQKHKPFK